MPGYSHILHTVGVGAAVYVALIVMLRLSGKRTLSKWNSFDFIVTVAFGSMLATTLLNENITLLQSIIAFALLIGLQYTITFISVRSRLFDKLIKAEPTILLYEGRLIETKLKQQRISKSEVLAAVRNHGIAGLEQVWAVVLETDGSMSVLAATDQPSSLSAMEDVKNDDPIRQTDEHRLPR